MKQLEKKTTTAFNKKIFLLGQDKEGTNYWLEAPSWDCGWYWGFAYIETYTDNRRPNVAKDISSHSHFDSMFMNGPENTYDQFKNFFVKTTLTDDEIWELCDYMKTFYTLRAVAELFGRGYSYYTEQAKVDGLIQLEQVDQINKVHLPEIFQRIEKLLS